MNLLVVAYVIASLVTALDDQLYCALRYRRLCQGKGVHVGCQFPELGPGVSCRNYSPIHFHNNLKQFITHYLNRRRQRIASGSERVRGGLRLPSPELMMMVEWDRELASLAQRLADQCTFVHDECRATVRYPYAGQTVGEVRWRRSSDDGMTAQRAIRRVFDAWWGERRRVQPHQLSQPFKLTAKGAVWGHFSQLAVWSLRAVGCGAVRHGLSYPRMLLVCDFSHTNMLGQRTLTPGPLVQCPEHTARHPRSAYSLLCAPVRHQTRTYPDDDVAPDTVQDYDDEDQLLRNVSTAAVDLLTTTVATSEKPIKDQFKHQNSEARWKAQHKCVHESRFPIGLHLERKMNEDQTVSSEAWSHVWRTTNVGQRASNPVIITSSELPLVVRHKWHQSRYRPKRPGANALLNIPAVTARHSLVAMRLDKEDLDQIFKDTGFQPIWAGPRL